MINGTLTIYMKDGSSYTSIINTLYGDMLYDYHQRFFVTKLCNIHKIDQTQIRSIIFVPDRIIIK